MKFTGSAKVLALVLMMVLPADWGWRLIVLKSPEVLAASCPAQQNGKVEPANQTTATVTGGTSTGLFTTMSPRTLRRSEFTLGFSLNNFDRDPGDLDINQIPVNLTIGLTDRVEIFANVNFYQQVTSRQPFALSGYQFNGVRQAFGGDPFVAFGAPVSGQGAAAAFFPLSGARLGGVLPPLGSYFGPAIVTTRPSFYNDLPFFGPATFISPDSGFNVRQSANGTGDVTLGLKVALTDPASAFNLGVAGLVRLPTARSFEALANGRGAGAVDIGGILLSGQNYKGNRIRFLQNVGYIHSGDPKRNDVKLLDRRDQLLLNTGVEIAPAQSVVLVGEWANTVYVAHGTPNLNPINPSDLLVGARFFGWEGRLQLGGGWRRLLNQANGRTIPVFVPGQGMKSLNIGSGDANGFVLNFAVARRASLIPPPPPNRPPAVTLMVEQTEVHDGESVRLNARAIDPDNDVLTYTWSYEPKTLPAKVLRPEGMPPGTPPTGDRVVFDATGVNPKPESPPVTVAFTVTVDDGRGGTASDSRTITVLPPAPPPPPPPPPPPVVPNRPPKIQSIQISPLGVPQVEGQITDGDRLRVQAVASDPDGDILVYRWTSTAGRRIGVGSDITLDTAGVAAEPGQPPVTVTISVTVDDGRGGTDSDSRTVTVMPSKRPEAIAQPLLVFTRPEAARITNVHKAALDSIADRLKQDPRATLVVDGHQDKGERANVALTRARNAATYLVRQKGVEPGRILIRSFGAKRPHPSGRIRMNRRVEMWIVPVGAELPPDRAATPETLPARKEEPQKQPQKPAPKREKPAPKQEKPTPKQQKREPQKQQQKQAQKPAQQQPQQQQKPALKQRKPEAPKQQQKQIQKPAQKEQPKQEQKQKQGQPQEQNRSSSSESFAASEVLTADANGTSVPAVTHRQRSLRVNPIRSEAPPPPSARQVARR